MTRFVVTAAAALAVVVAPAVLLGAGGGQNRQVAEPCYNGVIPLRPYLQSCSLPSKQPTVRGAAPDAGAIIACRHHPGCLSWYVNYPL